MNGLIEDIRNRKPIKVYMGGVCLGVYKWNGDILKYEGSVGTLTLNDLSDILKLKIEHLKIRRNSK